VGTLKRLIVFDLDGTLAQSKAPLDAGMAVLLHALLGIVKVAVISGGDWPQFEKQLLAHLPLDGRLAALSLLPTCGTKFRRYDGAWKETLAEPLTAEEKRRVVDSLRRAVQTAGLVPLRTWGETIEDRGTQITLSALGQQAPLESKEKWDPDFAKRRKIIDAMGAVAQDFSVRMGGTTSIDVTRRGVDKAYGIGKLRDVLGVPLSEMLFVGDAVFPGGNDYPAKEAGLDCIAVLGPSETKRVIETLVACLSPSVNVP
jgi:HAD superfamily hydrolase (TIGR01484 family)